MKYCTHCAALISRELQNCPHCGHPTEVVLQPTYQQAMMAPPKDQQNIIIGVVVSCCIVIIAAVFVLMSDGGEIVYFSDDNNINSEDDIAVEQTTTRTGAGSTVINPDNTYTLETKTTVASVLSQIVKDSVNQKTSCPQDIIEIEDRIIRNYEIASVNLCEMDKHFALELEKNIEYIYNEFPTARGYLSHLSLGNLGMRGPIAFFQWTHVFTDSTQDNETGMKIRIILNTRYFLNMPYFEKEMQRGAAAGHFPPNATPSTVMIHELAHYLSYIASNKYYNITPTIIYPMDKAGQAAIWDFSLGTLAKKISEEAYENYKSKTNTTMTLDQFRGSISEYAVARDENGEYIYDETIAEALSDVYVNGENAEAASKEVVSVLKKYLEM